ncbi:Rv3235 family protein [Thermopolyspora sp. NPDC052614]|uniref:Rv3235 family protein n=1 Tax=Thermopolyspora sp. NPDC052614 TaxID=3155682 RepID=UPI00341C76D0
MSRYLRPVALPRLVPTPRADPPYDDERTDATADDPAGPPATFGALALAPEPDPLVLDPPAPLPEPRRLRALGQAVAEVLAGIRPAASVADRFTDRAHAELVRAGTMLRTRLPPKAGLPHVHRPHDGAVEMCVLVNCGDRNHVLALRLERRGVQWLCTEFETA